MWLCITIAISHPSLIEIYREVVALPEIWNLRTLSFILTVLDFGRRCSRMIFSLLSEYTQKIGKQIIKTSFHAKGDLLIHNLLFRDIIALFKIWQKVAGLPTCLCFCSKIWNFLTAFLNFLRKWHYSNSPLTLGAEFALWLISLTQSVRQTVIQIMKIILLWSSFSYDVLQNCRCRCQKPMDVISTSLLN